MTPFAYLVVNDQGYIVCAYRELNLAERLIAKGQPTHNEKIVPVYEHSHIETEAEKKANRFMETRNPSYLPRDDSYAEALEIIRALLLERGIK